METDVVAFSWYEICILRAAVRMMRKKTAKDQQRSRQKFGTEWVDDSTKVELLRQMEKSLESLERQLKQQHGVDSIDAYHRTPEEKLNARKLIKLTTLETETT